MQVFFSEIATDISKMFMGWNCSSSFGTTQGVPDDVPAGVLWRLLQTFSKEIPSSALQGIHPGVPSEFPRIISSGIPFLQECFLEILKKLLEESRKVIFGEILEGITESIPGGFSKLLERSRKGSQRESWKNFRGNFCRNYKKNLWWSTLRYILGNHRRNF